MLITGNKYRIGDEIHEVTIEPADECCIDVCSVKNCTSNKNFSKFLNACKASCCMEILGVGRMFKKVEWHHRLSQSVKPNRRRKMNAANKKLDPGFWIGMILLSFLIYLAIIYKSWARKLENW